MAGAVLAGFAWVPRRTHLAWSRTRARNSRPLLAALPSEPVGQAWSTHRLGRKPGNWPGFASECAGILLVPLSSGGDVLAWFRGAVSRTLRSAADPERPVSRGNRGQR